jgi:2-deoxy-D-gluconate 3-dehydrogenase
MVSAFDLTGRAALITGGNRGIGRALALALATAGAEVAIAARDAAATATVVKEITQRGHRAVGITCDITRPADRDRAVKETVAAFGRLTILVNNAALTPPVSALPVPETTWEHVLDTNLKAAYFVAEAAYPALAASGRGKVINVGSDIALRGAPTQVAYGASKAALLHLTMSLAVAWAHQQIQVNALLPGITRTERWSEQWGEPLSEELERRIVQHTPAGRIAVPEDYAGAAVFLASHASDFMTGQALTLDGGLSCVPPLYD